MIGWGMRIEYHQTGGVVGGSWRAVIDTAELPPAKAQTLLRLVEDANFFNLPRGILRLPRLSTVDHFSYTISVMDGERKRRVQTDDIDMPAKLRPLVSYLFEHTRHDR